MLMSLIKLVTKTACLFKKSKGHFALLLAYKRFWLDIIDIKCFTAIQRGFVGYWEMAI